jgi:hypothetical protein
MSMRTRGIQMKSKNSPNVWRKPFEAFLEMISKYRKSGYLKSEEI